MKQGKVEEFVVNEQLQCVSRYLWSVEPEVDEDDLLVQAPKGARSLSSTHELATSSAPSSALALQPGVPASI
jgi:hypothetical protein